MVQTGMARMAPAPLQCPMTCLLAILLLLCQAVDAFYIPGKARVGDRTNSSVEPL
jgi:hypothetical protein